MDCTLDGTGIPKRHHLHSHKNERNLKFLKTIKNWGGKAWWFLGSRKQLGPETGGRVGRGGSEGLKPWCCAGHAKALILKAR